MKSEINKLFNGISDSELKEAIIEIKEGDAAGPVKGDGIVRKYGRLAGEIIGFRGYEAEYDFVALTNLLKQAAYRWAK